MAVGYTNANNIKIYDNKGRTKNGNDVIVPQYRTQYIPQRTYFKNDLVLIGDDNLKPENIANGKIIAGVMGRALEIPECSPYCGIFYKKDELFYPYGVGLNRAKKNKIFRVGQNLILLDDDDINYMYYSSDEGQTWTYKKTHTGADWRILYAKDIVQSEVNGMLVARTNSDMLIYSMDGLTWTQCSYSGDTTRAISYGNTVDGERWVVLSDNYGGGYDEYKLYYSIDGKNFISANQSLAHTYYEQYDRIVFYEPTKTFMIENSYSLSSGYKYTSTNGSSWTTISEYKPTFLAYLDDDPIFYNDIMYGMGRKDSVEGFTIKYSKDSRTWIDTGFATFVRENEGESFEFNFLNIFIMSNNEPIIVVGSVNLPYLYFGNIQDNGAVTWQIYTTKEFSCYRLQNLLQSSEGALFIANAYGGLYVNSSKENSTTNLFNVLNYKRKEIIQQYAIYDYRG